MKMAMNLFAGLLLFFQIGITQQHIKVVTYNLEGMKPGTQPETRIANIIEAFKKLNPDIIGLQEINEKLSGADNQIRVIADSLSSFYGIQYHYYQKSTHLSWDNQFREYIGIISKFPVIKDGYKSLPQGTFPRKVVWSYIETPMGLIRFFNTHLSYNSESTRIKQVGTIIDFIDAIEEYNEAAATILTGDFNSTPNTTPIEMLTSSVGDTFFIDSYNQAIPNSNGYTVPSTSPNSKIDYIFFKNTGSLSVDSSEIIMDPANCGGQVCSDHLGVLTTFRITATGIHTDEIIFKPQRFEVGQNYPNPFNPETVIPFVINKASSVTMAIFDVAGKEIKRFPKTFYSPGKYRIMWSGLDKNGKQVGSGIYYYILNEGDESDIGKMLLLK